MRPGRPGAAGSPGSRSRRRAAGAADTAPSHTNPSTRWLRPVLDRLDRHAEGDDLRNRSRPLGSGRRVALNFHRSLGLAAAPARQRVFACHPFTPLRLPPQRPVRGTALVRPVSVMTTTWPAPLTLDGRPPNVRSRTWFSVALPASTPRLRLTTLRRDLAVERDDEAGRAQFRSSGGNRRRPAGGAPRAGLPAGRPLVGFPDRRGRQSDRRSKGQSMHKNRAA